MPTVLVVDDEREILESVRILLQESLVGVAVESASSGPEALAVLERATVDLIVSDYRMDGMDGVEFLRGAARLAPGVPRVLITAYPRGPGGLAGSELPAEYFLSKPFAPAALLRIVEQALRARGQPEPARRVRRRRPS